MSDEPKGFRIGIAGASGTLGREILSVLSDRRFPIADLKPFASGGSIGEEIEFAIDERAFYETERDQVIDFISAPCRFFDLKNTHKRIIIFKEPIAITENQFKKVIKTWRKAPPTSA